MLTNSKCEMDVKHVDVSSKVLRLGCPPMRSVGAICEPAVTDTSECIPGKFHISSDRVVSEQLRLLNNGFRVDTSHHVSTSRTKSVGHMHADSLVYTGRTTMSTRPNLIALRNP